VDFVFQGLDRKGWAENKRGLGASPGPKKITPKLLGGFKSRPDAFHFARGRKKSAAGYVNTVKDLKTTKGTKRRNWSQEGTPRKKQLPACHI